MRTSVATLLLLALSLSSSVITVTSHGAATFSSGERPVSIGGSGDAGNETVRPAVTFEAVRVSGSDRLRYQLSVDPRRADELSLVVGRHASVIETEGLAVGSTDGRTRLRWTGADDVHAVIEVRASSNGDPTEGAEYFATDTWMLGRVPMLLLRWSLHGEGGMDQARILDDRFDAPLDGPAHVFGDRYALVGHHRTDVVEAGDQRIRIVTPVSGVAEQPRDAVRESLAAASRDLSVGDRDDSVLLFALPDPARRGGESFPARDEAWIHVSSDVDNPNNVWIHEYVHTRQAFRLGDDMQWFREASAEYYAARLTYEQGRTDHTAMANHITSRRYENAVLTSAETWPDAHVPYRRGAHVLARLDTRIRTLTDGQRSLDDVFRRMNEHEGRVTYEDFRRIVTDVTGQSMNHWLDERVDGHASLAELEADR